eukprot:Phypoly_transcript_04570.p1 GENE.Phypoly_transcript_04570~~Phypoly_transcript_04570.p1  ORF type:complete len:684 (+),score=95.55 Phypoly_transcript_04570:42-2054(+)
MSETEVVPPSVPVELSEAPHKDSTVEPTKSGDHQVVDGAHTHSHGTVTATEPVVTVAAPDTGTSNVNAQLLDPSKEKDTNQPPQTIQEITPENNEHETHTHTEIVSEPAQPHNTEPDTTEASKASSASNSNNTSSTAKNIPPHLGEMKGELRTSARNLRNSVLGIEELDEVDEHGVKKKIKRKERSHSRIVLSHKKNIIGETIFKGHQSWVLMLNIQTGIRNAVGRGNSRTTIQRPLTFSPSSGSVSKSGTPNSQNKSSPSTPTTPSTPPTPKYPADILGPESFDSLAEFYASPGVLYFPSEGSSTTIPHQTGPFKFKDYAPHAFRFLRHRFGIDTADYMVSLCNTQKNGENALRELPTPGKSGSLFFFSHDMRFILKTIPKSEAKLLRILLPSYVQHIANDENTLLPKFFGLHRVKPSKGRQVRFLVMNNVFQTRKVIHERYDLKGSTLGRAASEEEKKKDTVTYKDLDFRERHVKIQIGPQKRSALLEQLQRDCKFLAKLNIMDYSLLIGIHNSEKEDSWSDPPSPQLSQAHVNSSKSVIPSNSEIFHSIFQENDGGMKGFDEGGRPNGKYYYMGIIDILMLYSARKKFEHTYKTLRYGKDQEISSISPNEYATRFYEFTAASIVCFNFLFYFIYLLLYIYFPFFFPSFFPFFFKFFFLIFVFFKMQT